jgi:hypothetical protein
MAEDLETFLKNHPCTRPFKSGAWYDADGDRLEVWWSEEKDYTTEIQTDGLGVIAIGKTFDKHEVVSITVYSIRKLLREAGFDLVPVIDMRPRGD